MKSSSVPVILVHGWNSHPGIWDRLIPRLDTAGIPHRQFDHTALAGSPLPAIAAYLGDYLQTEIGSCKDREIDIVCHSVGTCIARYLLEVVDGETRAFRVRQLIGLGPPNNGSVLAELFSHPDYGPGIIDRLTGVFVPYGFDPVVDPIVQDVRPGSRVMQALRASGTRGDIRYRIIVTGNPEGSPVFFPLLSGETFEITCEGCLEMTRNGDGIVAHRDSELPGVSLDIIVAGKGDESPAVPPDQYCHINLPRNPVVIDRILQYLRSPGTSDERR